MSYLWVIFFFGFPQKPGVIWSLNISTHWTSNDIYKSTESIFHAPYANQGVRRVCRTHLVTLIGRDSNYAAVQWNIPSSSTSKTEERVYPYGLQEESGKFLVALECVIRKLCQQHICTSGIISLVPFLLISGLIPSWRPLQQWHKMTSLSLGSPVIRSCCFKG